MENIKRYDMIGEYDGYIGEQSDGDYVTYDDYQTIESQLQQKEQELSGISLALDNAQIDMENDSLLGRVITLREGYIYLKQNRRNHGK
jgi:hypothetical protein